MVRSIREPEYIPGTCNLGPEEIRRRYRIGYVGLALMAVVILSNEIFRFPIVFKTLLFFPAFYMISGFIQAIKRFCYVYGFKGIISLKGRRIFDQVMDEESLRQDRKLAILFVLISTIGGILITFIYFLI